MLCSLRKVSCVFKKIIPKTADALRNEFNVLHQQYYTTAAIVCLEKVRSQMRKIITSTVS